jgi:type VI secretion system secreted protein Hcp
MCHTYNRGLDVNKFLKLEGVTQGLIKGSVTQKGREGMISVLSFSHEVNSIYDPMGVIREPTRLPHLDYKPLVLVKLIDRSTPLLYKALATGELMKTFNLVFYAKTAAGSEVLQFTIDLFGAIIRDIVQVKQNSDSTPDLMKFAEYEQVSFGYAPIQWSWYDGPNRISYQRSS